MDATRWDRIQSVFHRATALGGDERRAYLDTECADDPELLADVLTLLDEDARGTPLLDRGVAHLASRLLDDATTLPLSAFGQYRVTELLGEGGMGIVYLAHRDDLGSRAAVKVLRDATLSPSRRARFASEQRTLAQLEHPSIARLYDAGTLADGTPWIVMEYVEGVPLTTYCESRGASVAERLRLFRLVCEAVQHAHRHAVIHRDLKPSNILVRDDGAVKLLDFGIAKQLGADDTADRTRTGLRLMTPAYAAPEQVRGDPVGTHTDVYALGVVLYELLVGHLPYDLSHRTPAEAEAMIVEGQAERPSLAARKAGRGALAGRAEWADLDVLCLTAMHADPQRRYRTVDALARDVDRYLRGEPLEARPDSLRYRVGKFVRRRRAPLAAAAAGLTLLVALVAFYTIRLAAARDAAVAEAARAQRIQRFTLNLFQGGDDAVGPADSLRVVTLVDRGAREARQLAAEPAVQAELYQTLGGIYQGLGRFGAADTLLNAALDQRRTLLGASHPDVARGLVALGDLRNAEAKYPEAERLVRDGIAMARRHLPADDPVVTRAITSLGKVFENAGEYDSAITALTTSIALQTRHGADSADLGETLTELANTQFYAGNYDRSDTLNRRVLALDRRLYGPRHPHVADDLINLAAIQFEKGRYADAERIHREALDIIRGWYGPNHPETASAMTMVARALVQEKRLPEADTLLRAALAINERAYGPTHPRVASTLNELGSVAVLQKRFDEAEADFKRLVSIYRTVYHDKHYTIGIALSNLAGVYLQTNRPDEAATLMRDVLRRYAEVLAPDHQLVGIAHVRLGHALLGGGHRDDAARESTAGLAILHKQSSPPPKWVDMARADLATIDSARKR